MAEPPRRFGSRRLARRDVLRGLLLGGAGLVGVAACSVPSSGKPHIDGDGPSAGTQGYSNANIDPPSPAGITDPQEFVHTFLMALASPSDEQSRAAAIANAATFLTPAARKEWQADPKNLMIVRTNVGKPTFATGASVVVDLAPVGELTAGGWIKSAPGTQTHASFQLIRDEGAPSANITWRIDSPLPSVLANQLLLSSDALTAPHYYYSAHLVYYWDAASLGLVPDLRYLPSVGLKREQQPTQIVNWLISGPSDWLEPAVTPLPAGTSLVLPNVAKDKTDNSWVVDFANLQNVDDLSRVAAQLQWSLKPNFSEDVHLQIASQDKPADATRYMSANLADTPARPTGDPMPYFIVGGQVREAKFPNGIPPVFSTINELALVSAAVSRDLKRGAVVRSVKGGKHQLLVGQLASDSAKGADFTVVNLLTAGTSISRPVWLNLSTPRLLFAADGVLCSVGVGGQPVAVPIDGGSNFTVSAFSVSPDARRIALISGGRAAVAPLTFTTDTVVVGKPVAIDAGGLSDLTAVAWSRTHCLVLAGTGPASYGLVEVNLDGAVSTPLGGNLDSRVAQLVASPPLPSSLKGLDSPGPIMVQTQTLASLVNRDNTEPLSYVPTPSGSPSGTTTPPPGQNTPTGPFYLD